MLRKLMRAMSSKWDMAESQAIATATVLFSMLGMGEKYQAAAQDPFAGIIGDTRAQRGADSATNLVVGLVVAGLMAAFLLPIAIEEISNVSTTGWSDGAASLWSVLPIMIVLAIFLFFVGLALNSRR